MNAEKLEAEIARALRDNQDQLALELIRLLVESRVADSRKPRTSDSR